uniref:Uncharacterized protein n=1 Tax=Trichobilharzia regenti TaxID=157069 RepID=A0AA85KFB8_TRIRE|nr:unnamed protein product [Trichobilharzia regenti]
MEHWASESHIHFTVFSEVFFKLSQRVHTNIHLLPTLSTSYDTRTSNSPFPIRVALEDLLCDFTQQSPQCMSNPSPFSSAYFLCVNLLVGLVTGRVSCCLSFFIGHLVFSIDLLVKVCSSLLGILFLMSSPSL